MFGVRTGFGYDVHAFGGDGPVILAGVAIDSDVGVVATSDGDVVAHAVADAVLGAAGAGDLGDYYPSDDPASQGADSMAMLRECVTRVQDRGYETTSVDVTVVVEHVRIAPHRDAMRQNLAKVFRVAEGQISVKGKTTDGLGFVGAGEGLAAFAVVTIQR